MKILVPAVALIALLWIWIPTSVSPAPPVPEPQPVVPIPGEVLRVLIVEETDERSKLPSSQVALMLSGDLYQWLTDHKTEWHIWDKDVDVSRESQVWQDAMKIPRQSLPWLIVSNGKNGESVPLPKSWDEMAKLLEKYQ